MKKKGLLAALLALLLGIGLTQAGQSKEKQKVCCPACQPPEICCCE